MEDDALYAKQCGEGNTEAFGILYDRYIEKIYRFIYYKTFLKETAEDLTSDVFHKAFQKINSYNAAKGPFSAWLYRIARNTVIDYYRTRKSTVSLEDIFDVGEENRTVAEKDAVRTLEKITEYLKTVNARQREIITLRIWEERSYKEIAEMLGGTEDSVKMAFSRGIRDLRETCGPLALALFIALGQIGELPFHNCS